MAFVFGGEQLNNGRRSALVFGLFLICGVLRWCLDVSMQNNTQQMTTHILPHQVTAQLQKLQSDLVFPAQLQRRCYSLLPSSNEIPVSAGVQLPVGGIS